MQGNLPSYTLSNGLARVRPQACSGNVAISCAPCSTAYLAPTFSLSLTCHTSKRACQPPPAHQQYLQQIAASQALSKHMHQSHHEHYHGMGAGPSGE